MKLLLVTPYFYPKIGGMENYAYNISKGLKEKYGWKIAVVTSNHEEKKYKEDNTDAMKIYRLAPWFKISNTPINPLWYFQIKKIIKKEKPDVINAHTPVPFISDVTTRVCGNIPFVLTYHATSLYKYKNPIFNIFIFLYCIFIEKGTFDKAKRILAVSESFKGKSPRSLRRKTVVVPNSISEKDILSKTKLETKKNKVIFLASLDKTHMWKGLDTIIQAVKWHVQNLSEEIELLVVGDGNYKKYYERLAKDLEVSQYVKFAGAKFGKQKYNLIRKSKILVSYPKTSNDAFPTVFLEAWANLIAIISSNINTISYVVDDRKNGYLVNPNSPKELAEGMYDLMQNDRLRNELIRNGWSKVKKFTWDKQIEKTKKIIELLTKKTKK